MKTSFAPQAPIDVDATPVAETEKKEIAPVTAAETAPAAALTVPPATSPAVPDSFFNAEGMEGDYDRSDLQLPRLALVHGVGPLSEHFAPGHFVFNKEVDLGVGPIKITLLRMQKYYLEDVPYGSEVFPKRLNTLDEVRKEGAFLLAEKRDMGEGHTYFKPCLDVQVLIKGTPDNVVFPFTFGGTPYAIGIWSIQSATAYNRAAKQFITASQFALKQTGLAGGEWDLQAKREKFGTNFVWVPTVRQSGRNTPEFIEFAKSVS